MTVQGDRAAEDVDPICGVCWRPTLCPDRITCRRDADGDRERYQSQCWVVGGGEARIKRQHRHEVGRPDAGTRAEAGHAYPDQAVALLALQRQLACGAGIDAERRKRRRHADQSCKQDEPQIVRGRHACDNAKHGRIPTDPMWQFCQNSLKTVLSTDLCCLVRITVCLRRERRIRDESSRGKLSQP